MPKIITREFDNSTTGITLAPSFGVVVPGYSNLYCNLNDAVAAGAPYDENGVIELSSTTQFDTYVGKFNREYKATGVAAAGPTSKDPTTIGLTSTQYTIVEDANNTIFNFVDTGVFVNETVENEDDFNAKLAAGVILYYKTGTRSVVYHKATSYDSAETYFTSVLDNLALNAQGLYEATAQASETAGKLKSRTYAFTKVTYINTVDSIDFAKTYAFLSDEGNDEVEDVKLSTSHIGNQIAYMLLQLGYPVLFKLLQRPKTAAEVETVIFDSHVQLADSNFWNPLKDTTIYDYRYLTHGGQYESDVAANLINVANFDNTVTLIEAGTLKDTNGRGDVIALVDVDESFGNIKFANQSLTTQEQTIYKFLYNANQITASKYAAIFAPKVIYNLSTSVTAPFGENKTFPASFHYLACAAQAQEYFAEWYAVAGYNRGIAPYSILGTTYKLGSVAVNTLSPRCKFEVATGIYNELIDGTVKATDAVVDKAINIIKYERGNYYLWTNRTANALAAELKFSDFLNIRQLCTTIKKTVRQACNQFTFDPNSDLLWINFVNAIEPMLQNMKNDQGIRGYKISKVANNKKALMTARIRIVPIEAVEDFDISLYLEDSLEGIIVSADESEAIEG